MKQISRFACVAIFLAVNVGAQNQPGIQDPWSSVRRLEGVWEGQAEGFGQKTTLTHKWQFVLDNKFLRLETRSIGISASGGGEIHEDVGYVSWSPGEKLLRFRQFLSEGFVNTFTVEEVISPQSGLNFEPEDTEGTETLSARMTLRFQDAETYEMVLELGAKGKELKPCQTMKLRKVKQPASPNE